MIPFIKVLVFSTVFFYSTGQPYDIFSNTTAVPVTIQLNGKTYHARSTEAVFQGLKGLGNSARKNNAERLIQDTNTPLSQLRTKAEQLGFNNLGQNEIYNQPYQNGNVTVKEEVMYEILLVKASQHPQIAKALLETGNVDIVENTAINQQYNDEFWGNGHSRQGKNALGKAWMRVRQTFTHEIQAGGIPIRGGVSNGLARTLGLRNHKPNSEYTGRVILQQDLMNLQSINQVKDLKRNNVKNIQNSRSYNNNSQNHRPKAAFLRLKQATGADSIEMIDDINVPNQKVLKLTFKDNRTAKQFSVFAGHAPKKDRVVFLGPKRAEMVFKKMHITIHGRTNPRPLWQALLWEAGY